MSDYLIWATECFISMFYGEEMRKVPEIFNMFLTLISYNIIEIPECLSLEAYAEVVSNEE